MAGSLCVCVCVGGGILRKFGLLEALSFMLVVEVSNVICVMFSFCLLNR